jgi:hypothetical protein
MMARSLIFTRTFPAQTRQGMLFDRQRPLLREENNVLSVFGKIE